MDKKSGPKLNVHAKLRTAAGSQSLVAGGFFYLPFAGGLSANSTQSVPSLLSADGRNLVVPRDGTYTINASGVLEDLTAGGVYALCLIANAAGQTGNTVFAQVLTAGTATDVPFLPVTDFFAAGTSLTIAIYSSVSGGNLRNLVDSDRFYFFLTEV